MPNTMEALGFDLKDNGLHIVLSRTCRSSFENKLPGLWTASWDGMG